MATVIMDRELAESLRQERAAAGGDRWDEVWEGTYMMAPLPDIEHQELVSRLATIFLEVAGWNSGTIVLPGANVSDRDKGWEHNYRCPDVVVHLAGTKAKNCGTHWRGGPDFAVEIVSPYDQARDKLPFYAKVGTRELLIVERHPWRLELYRLSRKKLQSVGKATTRSRRALASRVLPLTFQLNAAKPRPVIRVQQVNDDRRWDA